VAGTGTGRAGTGAATGAGATGAVVTGGAGGLGRAIAAVLLRRGYRVWVADLDASAAERVAAELGPGAVGCHLDVTDADASRSLARTVDAAVGLGVWVNNAGLLPTGPSWGHPPGVVTTAFAVNTHGTINGTEAALEVLRPRGRGHVVNIVSLAGLVAAPGETVYSATKHAALAYTVGTGLDLRRYGSKGIHVCAVCPDGIWTPMLEDKLDDPEAALSWSGTLLAPEQVAEVVGDLLRRPRPVVSVPRWRGGLARLSAAFPRVTTQVEPLVTADARRRQRAFAKRHRAGRTEG
jgi:NAD(P)-dependent dehydrogenase (short-subunit alcohol dehydrogenase family)